MRVVVFLLAVAAITSVSAQQSPEPTVAPFLWQAEMAGSSVGEINVFRRFSSERAPEMREFYGEVLALTPLPDSAIGGGRMIRYPVGSSEVKLFPSMPSAANASPASGAIGVRLLTFFYLDRAALEQRFAEHGYGAPRFVADPSRSGATAAALVQDPDGQWVELVVKPRASAEDLARFEIGITVADIEASRAFYAGVLGLAERPSVRDELLETTRYPFTHGATTINLFPVDSSLPKDTVTGGIQYIVWNVAAIDRVVQERGARIDRPLSAPGQMRTLWLLDPDGVSNYFAEFAGNDNTPPATR